MLSYFSDIKLYLPMLGCSPLLSPHSQTMGTQRTPIEEACDPKIEIDLKTLYGIVQI